MSPERFVKGESERTLMARNKMDYAPNENFLQKISTECEEALLSYSKDE